MTTRQKVRIAKQFINDNNDNMPEEHSEQFIEYMDAETELDFHVWVFETKVKYLISTSQEYLRSEGRIEYTVSIYPISAINPKDKCTLAWWQCFSTDKPTIEELNGSKLIDYSLAV